MLLTLQAFHQLLGSRFARRAKFHRAGKPLAAALDVLTATGTIYFRGALVADNFSRAPDEQQRLVKPLHIRRIQLVIVAEHHMISRIQELENGRHRLATFDVLAQFPFQLFDSIADIHNDVSHELTGERAVHASKARLTERHG